MSPGCCRLPWSSPARHQTLRRTEQKKRSFRGPPHIHWPATPNPGPPQAAPLPGWEAAWPSLSPGVHPTCLQGFPPSQVVRVVEVGHPGLPAVAHVHLELVGTVKLSKLLGQVARNLNHRQEGQRLTSLASLVQGWGSTPRQVSPGRVYPGSMRGLHRVYEGLHEV